MIKLIYITPDQELDITNYTGNYQRADNLSSLGMSFTFDLLNNPADKNANGRELSLGGKVIFYNDGAVVFSGILAKVDRKDLTHYSYTAFDYGFFLNKSEAFIQFNDIPISEALNRLCDDNNVAVGKINTINTKVSKIYKGDTISDIIKDLLELAAKETANKYRLEVRENKLFIEDYKELTVNAVFKLSKNSSYIDSALYIGEFSSSQSIEDMKNRVQVISSSEKNMQILGKAEDSKAIQTYGLLTKVEQVEDKNEDQAQEIAKNKLNELNKVKKTFNVTLFGDDKIRAGRTIICNQSDIGLVGSYLIKSCTHSYKSDYNHIMRLELEV